MKLVSSKLDFLFNAGVFFLATAPFISIILFLPCVVNSFFKIPNKLLKDKVNISFLIGTIFMIISSVYQYFFNSEFLSLGWDKNNSLIGLLNWIPFLFCFIAFQDYLRDRKSREKFSFYIVAGSIPVLISVIFQVVFKFHGPFSTLNGLIVWYQRPVDFTNYGATGIFNNPNYLASWLLMVFPFSLSFLFRSTISRGNKFFILILNLFFCTTLISTLSRNGIIGMIITFILIFGKKFLFILLCLTLFFFITNILSYLFNFLYLETFFGFSFFEDGFSQLRNLNLSTIRSFSRVDIWLSSLKYIISRPIFGIGSGVFPILYEARDRMWGQHAHNLFLEISLNHGVLASIAIFFGFLLLIFKSFKINNISYLDKIWQITGIIFLYNHLFDVTYYDGRISILCWLIFAGLRSIIREKSLTIN